MYTRNDITPEDMAHISKLCHEMCADLPQRIARYRRRMTFFRLALSLCLLLLVPVMVNAAHPHQATPSMTLTDTFTPPMAMEQITYMLKSEL